jgi:hypothetical protein
MDRKRVLKILRDDVQSARKHLQDATDYLDLAIHHHRNPFPTKNSQERVRCAARSYRDAIVRLAAADSRVKDFEASGIVAEDLQPRRPPEGSNWVSKRAQQIA